MQTPGSSYLCLPVITYPIRLIIFLTIATLARLCLISSFELIPDEAYYWGWSRHLQGGYLDHPPMVAFLIALTTRIGGNSEVMIRLAAALPLLGFFIIAYALGRDIFQSEKTGFYSVVWLNVILLFSLGSVR